MSNFQVLSLSPTFPPCPSSHSRKWVGLTFKFSNCPLYPPWQPKSDNIRFRTLMYSILHFQGVQSVTVLTCPPVILLPLLDTSYFLFLCWPVHWVNLSWCGASPGFVALKWPSRLVWLSRVTHFSRRSFHQLLLTQIISSLLSTY